MTPESANGSCLCGAVRFSARLPRFCGDCGSPMFFQGARWPGELHVARALFTGPLDREPQMHAYHDSHVTWVTLADGLPTRDDPGAASDTDATPQ